MILGAIGLFCASEVRCKFGSTGISYVIPIFLYSYIRHSLGDVSLKHDASLGPLESIGGSSLWTEEALGSGARASVKQALRNIAMGQILCCAEGAVKIGGSYPLRKCISAIASGYSWLMCWFAWIDPTDQSFEVLQGVQNLETGHLSDFPCTGAILALILVL